MIGRRSELFGLPQSVESAAQQNRWLEVPCQKCHTLIPLCHVKVFALFRYWSILCRSRATYETKWTIEPNFSLDTKVYSMVIQDKFRRYKRWCKAVICSTGVFGGVPRRFRKRGEKEWVRSRTGSIHAYWTLVICGGTVNAWPLRFTLVY